MRGERAASLLDAAAAHAISSDVDLWPALQPKLRPRPRLLHSLQRMGAIGVRVLALACLGFAVILTLSPDARAEVLAQTGVIIRKIGELTFTNAFSRPPAGSTPMITPPAEFPYVGHSQGMTLAEARAAVPFAFNIPTWTPGDFYGDDQIGVYTMTSKDCGCVVAWTVSKLWVKPATTGQDAGIGATRITINLTILQEKGPIYPRVYETDLATLEELTLNGRPTALLGPEGVIPAEPRLVELSKTLMWTQGDLVYSLRGSPGVQLEDMIRMAESIP